jgi:hypothetical protein
MSASASTRGPFLLFSHHLANGFIMFLHFSASSSVRRVFAALFIPFCIFGHDRDINFSCSGFDLSYVHEHFESSTLRMTVWAFTFPGIPCKCWHVLEIRMCCTTGWLWGSAAAEADVRGVDARLTDAGYAARLCARCEIENQGLDWRCFCKHNIILLCYL